MKIANLQIQIGQFSLIWSTADIPERRAGQIDQVPSRRAADHPRWLLQDSCRGYQRLAGLSAGQPSVGNLVQLQIPLLPRGSVKHG